MNGIAVIKPEQITDGGIVTAGPISYRGSFEVEHPSNKRGDLGQCYGRIPRTDLTTKNFDSRSALQDALKAGDCTVK